MIDTQTLESMTAGSIGWAVPWAMWLDLHGRYWLNPSYDAHPKFSENSTRKMRVERRDDGWHVWPPATTEYEPKSESPYVSGQLGVPGEADVPLHRVDQDWIPARVHPNPDQND